MTTEQEPICLNCNLPGNQCGCEPSGLFDPADVRKCEICAVPVPDDIRLCDDCTVNLMLYVEIRDRMPS